MTWRSVQNLHRIYYRIRYFECTAIQVIVKTEQNIVFMNIKQCIYNKEKDTGYYRIFKNTYFTVFIVG